MSATPPPSAAETMAILLARDIADGEKAIIGTNSDLQLAACNLARLRQAPNLWWVSGPGGMVNPTRDHLASTADHENINTAEAWMDLPEMIEFIDWRIHFFDFAILSAVQVDRFGNINTTLVGDPAKPKLRGPGTVGLSALCGLSHRFNVVIANHTRHSFVPRVDFISGVGHLDGDDSRERRGLPVGGPRLVVSPLGAFDFHPVSRHMRIKSVQPGVTVKQIQEATGFELLVEGTPPDTQMPSVEELHLLRTRVDSTGRLRKEVA